MPSLVVGGVTIPVAISSPAWNRTDAVDRGRMFDGTFFASESGGATRDWTFATPPVTQALADTYIAALSSPAAKLCSGDIIQIPTMCSPELPSGKPTRAASSNRVVLDFMLHEVMSARVLLRYAPGDTITGESFTRSTTAYQINASGVLVSAAINVKRDAHYIGGVRSFLLEGARTNNLLWANDFNNAVWAKLTMTVGTGISDPAGGTSACTLTATGANAEAYQHPADGSSIVRITSVWLKRRTGTGDVRVLNANGTDAQIVAITSSWARYATTAAAASVSRWGGVRIDTSGDAVDVWCCQNENGAFISSEIPTTTVAITRGDDIWSLPFTVPPQEMSVYVKRVEKGTILATSGRVLQISNAAGAAPHLILYNSGTFYRVYHDDVNTPVFSTLAVAPAIGNTHELNAHLFGDGSVDLTQSIDGAVSTTSAPSSPKVFAGAWSGLLAWPNSNGTAGAEGYAALQSLKIVAGARSLAEMRTL